MAKLSPQILFEGTNAFRQNNTKMEILVKQIFPEPGEFYFQSPNSEFCVFGQVEIGLANVIIRRQLKDVAVKMSDS